MAIETINPALAVGRRLAGTRQALVFDAGGRRSGLLGGGGIEQEVEWIRRCR
jgi:hypothetical protein